MRSVGPVQAPIPCGYPVFLDQSLLGEELNQLTDRLDADGTTPTRWAGVAPALSRVTTTAELIALLHRDDARPAGRREQIDGWDDTADRRQAIELAAMGRPVRVIGTDCSTRI